MLNLNDVMWKQATRLHEVSNTGEIRNLNGRSVKPWVGTTGYMTIKIYIDGKRKNKKLHRLIAEVFIPNPENKPEVNHIDGDKLNNHISNLEWCSHKENMAHAGETGLIKTTPRTMGQKLGKTSKYHNVGWDTSRNKWTAGITHNGKSSVRKRFDTEEEAALFVNYILDTLELYDRPRNIIY